MVARAKTFSMPLVPHVDAVLVFDADDADVTGTYAIYSIEPGENERFVRGEWEAMKQSLTPTRHVPVTDVGIDEETHEIRVRTYGIERDRPTLRKYGIGAP